MRIALTIEQDANAYQLPRLAHLQLSVANSAAVMVRFDRIITMIMVCVLHTVETTGKGAPAFQVQRLRVGVRTICNAIGVHRAATLMVAYA